MGAKGGFALKLIQWFVRVIQFLCAAVVLALFSYFLAALSNHSLRIDTWVRAVEGISGLAVLYTLFALVLLWCLAGRTITSIIAIVLDVAFIGGFIYIAQANRDGARSCQGIVPTVFGTGDANDRIPSPNGGGFTNLPSFRQACQMHTAVLAVSIVAIFFFIFSIALEVMLARHHRKEKRFGPGPDNNYTSGYGSKHGSAKRGGLFSKFGRNRRNTAGTMGTDNALPAHTTPDQVRHSYNTETTAVPPGTAFGAGEPKHGHGLGHHNHGDNGVVGNGAGYEQQQPQPAAYRYNDGTYDRA